MKKGLLIVLLVFTHQLVAQKASPVLLKSYTKAELQAFEQDGKGTIQVLNYAVDHACYTIVAPEGKDVSQFPTISVKSKKEMRFTDFQLQIKDHTQYFRILNSNEILVVKSINILQLEMKNKK